MRENNIANIQITQHKGIPFLVYIALRWWLDEGEFTHHVTAPAALGEDRCTMRDLDSGYQGSVCELLWTWPQRQDILLWLMTGDTCKICDLWRSRPCWSHTRRGISRGLIPAESCRNGHRRDSSLSYRSCCWELPWTAALCDTFYAGQLPASDRSQNVLKCSQVW